MKRFFLFIGVLFFLSSCGGPATSLSKDFLYESYDWKRESTGGFLGNMFLSILAGTAVQPFKSGQCLDATVEEMRDMVVYDALSSGKKVKWERDTTGTPRIIIGADLFTPGISLPKDDDRRFLITTTTVIRGMSNTTFVMEWVVIKKKGQMILIWRQPGIPKTRDKAEMEESMKKTIEFWEKVAANDESNYKPLLPSKKCK